MDVRQATTPASQSGTVGVLMSNPEATVSTKQVRAYRFLAAFVAIGLVVAFVVGARGLTGPGVLSPESAFLVAGLAILVIAIALVYMLITYRHAFTRLQVQHAMLKALESDLRKTAAESQSFARQASVDRARIAGLEPRVGQTAALSQDVAQRLQGIETRQQAMKETNVAFGHELETLKDEQSTLRSQQTDHETALREVAERVDGIEYTTTRITGETATQVEWLHAEWAEHGKRDAILATQIGQAQDAVNRFEETQTRLEARLAAVESEEDSQDYRFDALDQRLAVVELEVANAPRLTRALEQRVGDLEKQEQDEPSDALARLAVQAEATARLSDEMAHVSQGIQANSETVSRLEARMTAAETINAKQDDEIARLANGLVEHEKHALPVTVADLRAPTIVPIRGDDDLAAIEGIGSVFRARLRENNVRSYNELRAADAEQLAPRIGTRPKTIRGWQAMAELMQLPNIDHQVAELLVRIGVTNREGLAQSSPRSIVERVRDYNERHEIPLQPRTLDEELAKKWVDAAQPTLVATIG